MLAVPVARAIVFALFALLGLLAGPARSATVGMSDGRPALFDSEDLHDIDFRHVRLVLPWDAARRTGTWTTWLDRASAQGWSIMVSPSSSGAAPAVADYEAALRTLLGRYPKIDAVEGWNEPNHAAQPTAGRPDLAAAYFEAARRACGTRCIAVAGNLLDAGSMGSYLAQYRAALTTRPAVWGIHNYFDSTYFQRTGIDQVLAITDGPVWMTETGGLVAFQPNGPGTGLLPDEHRAADGLRWLFRIAQTEPRLHRMYLYGMWQEPWNAFDSALVRVDNTEREGMQVVRQQVGLRPVAMPGAPVPSAVAAGATPSDASADATGSADVAAGASDRGEAASLTPPILRLVGKRIAVDRTSRRARITIRCVLSDCVGRLTVRAGGWRYSRGIRLRAGAIRSVTVRVDQSALTDVRRRHATATLCASSCSMVPLRLS
jgi:hypothetical protein